MPGGIGGKWAILILTWRRRSALQHNIPNLSQKILIQMLRKLEPGADWVSRNVTRTIPSMVDYDPIDMG